MNKNWLLSVLFISFTLLALLKCRAEATLIPYFRAERIIQLTNFSKAKKLVSQEDLENLKLWESILTGRVGPVSKWIRERYRKLALAHLFTPSGFHISAVILPFMLLIRKTQYQFIFLTLLNVLAHFLPGMSALKRMLLIKAHQKILGQHFGFCLALLLDVLFGSFQEGALSFTYSFLFIGIIYSGLSGLPLAIWFFIAQSLLALFQGNDVSPLLLLFSPLLNLCFGIAMPFLFFLACPLWGWQLSLGLWIMKALQFLVELCAALSVHVPTFEVHVMTIMLFLFILYKRWRSVLVLMMFMSSSLNLDHQRTPSWPTNALVPQGKISKVIYGEKENRVYFEDGTCKMRLVRGFWWENCSPKRRSNRKKFKKLSYPSRDSRKSFLRG